MFTHAKLLMFTFASLSWAQQSYTISTFAGSNPLGERGPATSALLSSPQAVADGPAGNYFISDSGNNRLREVTTDGTIRPVVVPGPYGFAGDGGPAASARLSRATGIALDPAIERFGD